MLTKGFRSLTSIKQVPPLQFLISYSNFLFLLPPLHQSCSKQMNSAQSKHKELIHVLWGETAEDEGLTKPEFFLKKRWKYCAVILFYFNEINAIRGLLTQPANSCCWPTASHLTETNLCFNQTVNLLSYHQQHWFHFSNRKKGKREDSTYEAAGDWNTGQYRHYVTKHPDQISSIWLQPGLNWAVPCSFYRYRTTRTVDFPHLFLHGKLLRKWFLCRQWTRETTTTTSRTFNEPMCMWV